ncbi:hypothetical protein [Chryseobacterium indoltheticum]|uniref:hypothetical protein n=1 Tax=Chryseobacterium indoltheticum TaxID=254 RepID=UPI003F491DEA
MIQKYRKQFNEEFSSEKYDQIKSILEEKSGVQPTFRLSESPIFLTKEFKEKLVSASESIIDQIKNFPEETLKIQFLKTVKFLMIQNSLIFSP